MRRTRGCYLEGTTCSLNLWIKARSSWHEPQHVSEERSRAGYYISNYENIFIIVKVWTVHTSGQYPYYIDILWDRGEYSSNPTSQFIILRWGVRENCQIVARINQSVNSCIVLGRVYCFIWLLHKYLTSRSCPTYFHPVNHWGFCCPLVGWLASLGVNATLWLVGLCHVVFVTLLAFYSCGFGFWRIIFVPAWQT